MSKEPMEMHDLLLAAQLLSEERVGKRVREYQRQEDRAVESNRRRMLRGV